MNDDTDELRRVIVVVGGVNRRRLCLRRHDGVDEIHGGVAESQEKRSALGVLADFEGPSIHTKIYDKRAPHSSSVFHRRPPPTMRST